MLTRKRRKKGVTHPVYVVGFSKLTSSPFTTGDAKVKETDAKSVQVRMKSAKRDMENWIRGQ